MTEVMPKDGSGRVRLIIIDASREFMGLVRRVLAARLPQAEISEYDPEQQGKPGPGFDWSLYDMAIVGQNLEGPETGLEWIAALCRMPSFPPALLMAEGDEYLAARAIKLGACDYIRRQDALTSRISDTVVEVLDAGTRSRSRSRAPLIQLPERHLAVLEKLGSGPAPEPDDAVAVHYRFVRLIGQGAHARIYLAERASDATATVLKLIDFGASLNGVTARRFMREAELLSAVTSAQVVRIHDYGLTADYGYIAMEFFARGDLKQRLERPQRPEDALRYLEAIALGLTAIHARGIVHRDLKPGNVMFRADDSLAIADFGIARRLHEESDLTVHGRVVGTPNYLSPEQAKGEPVDARSDLYSAGVIAYELLSGHKPYRAENAAAMVYQHVHKPVPRLPAALSRYQDLVDSLMAKNRDDRCASADVFLEAVRRLTS